MTGHQPHPGVNMQDFNMTGYGRVSIEKVVRAIGVPYVEVIKPYRVNKSIAAIKEAIDYEGVSVIISKEACTLYAQSLKKARGKPFYINEKCKNHRDCVNELACPAFFIEGEKVHINADLCTGCAVCAQICPEKAIVPIRSKEKVKSS
jgi:indolepyruvate ferredoxin oxidoreductase alpha subunit